MKELKHYMHYVYKGKKYDGAPWKEKNINLRIQNMFRSLEYLQNAVETRQFIFHSLSLFFPKTLR